jgi:Ca2+-binding RTX toxin-like protein
VISTLQEAFCLALFQSDTAFNITSINFNLSYQGAFDASVKGNGTFTSGNGELIIRGVSFDYLGPLYRYESKLIVTWGDGMTNALMGDDLVFQADDPTQILEGTARTINSFGAQITDYSFADLNLDAATVGRAMRSNSTDDDREVVRQMLSGSDIVFLSRFQDAFNSGSGSDLIKDSGGSDWIHSGSGNDLVSAGGGNDRVQGGFGRDLLLGRAGFDQLDGGGGDDTVWGGAGNDTMTGGPGSDAFLFQAGDGLAKITDFSAAEDQILFMGTNSDFANLSIEQLEDSVRITFSDVTVLLMNTLLSGVTPTNINLGGDSALYRAATAFFDDWHYAA